MKACEAAATTTRAANCGMSVGTAPVACERLLEVSDGLELRGPQSLFVERWQPSEARAQCPLRRDVVFRIRRPVGERLWFVEGEHPSATGVGIESVGERVLTPVLW